MTPAAAPTATQTATPAGAAPPPRPKRRLPWILAALLGAVFVVLPAAWQAGAYGATRTATLHGGSAGHPVSALRIAGGGGANITVRPRGDQQVGYRAEVAWSHEKPVIEESWQDGTLTLTPRCPDEDSWLTGGLSCSVQLGIGVPANLPVTVTATSGRIDIGGLGGPVDARVDSGQVQLTGLRGAVRARAGSGRVVATALTAPEIALVIGSGLATVDFVAPPQKVTADIGSGRLALTVPDATTFRVAQQTGSGRIDLGPGLAEPASPRTLDLTVGSGRVDARYLDLLG
ncbi:DUF4097 family beta strand repeat protein [Streptomyces sp. ISL-66]|uniref:DUF4097 family beta strand repeat-containing protein n=1 Tax=Streptomyces sp. ISL-66 TaxID=2819186 RepID=UPI001BE903C1|nr:DUF4097 family beta strand repeat-containing protein [Streptomyces sp. ISL-66]MBT2471480.1 DUF4097 family beta strand repeat protein [Streptomyces sp. ISL-66]